MKKLMRWLPFLTYEARCAPALFLNGVCYLNPEHVAKLPEGHGLNIVANPYMPRNTYERRWLWQ